MGFFANLFRTKKAPEVIKETTDGIGGLAKDIRTAITGRAPDEPLKMAEIEMKAKEIEAKVTQVINEVNKAEAQHSSLFVAGWRPCLGWALAIGIAINILIRPILSIWGIMIPDLPPIVFGLMSGLLGVTVGARTYEKLRDVNWKH
jgi:hypothetical protein